MSADSKAFYSSVPGTLVDTVLKEGFFFAIFGLFLISIPAVVRLSPQVAIPSLLLGLFLITKGLLSYKRLKNLQLKPYKLIVTEHEMVLYKESKELYSLSFSEIKEIEYIKKGKWFGIRATLLDDTQASFPYFKVSCFKELLEIMSLEE